MPPPVRVGLMTGGASVPRWTVRTLDQIDACSVAELVGWVQLWDARQPPAGIASARGGRSRLLFELYSQLDRRRFGGAAEDLLAEVDVSRRLARVPVVRVEADAEPVSQVKEWDLDVLLVLGHASAPDGVLECARFGVWSYEPDREGDAARAPLFGEVYENASVAAAALHRFRAGAAGAEVIYASFSATDPLSLHRTRSRVYGKSGHFVVRKLRELHREGDLAVAEPLGQALPPPIRRIPTNRRMLRFGGRLAVRLWRRKALAMGGRQQWFLAYRRRVPGLPTSGTLGDAKLLVPPRDRFYADPCLVDWGGATYLFFEDYDFGTENGVISCCRLMPDGRSTPPEVVLERPYHLSYPFVFFVGEEAFMLPETAANRTIELYKAGAFPGGWEPEAVLVNDIDAVDPTLLEHDGRFWLFANVAVDGASHDDELCLFSAATVRGPWQPHPANPVISDVRRARPAGRPFLDDEGNLIRPSQDCSSAYGSAVVFSRVDELTEDRYREVPIGRLGRGWRASNLGTHTYARSDLWEALDGRAWVRRCR